MQCVASLLLLYSVFDQAGLVAAESQPNGRQIYRQLCVKCHGRSGEGIKGKYNDALHGDWAIEKLTRYIDKNMPDDAPEKCVGADAEAVARFIYDSFYSREARARNHPPRIELLHLTNRQYVNTVADLLKDRSAFEDYDAEAAGARGYGVARLNQLAVEHVLGAR